MTETECQNSVSYSKLREEVLFTPNKPSTPVSPTPGEKLEFTVDEAIEKIGFGMFQLRLSVFSALVWMADAMEMMMLAVLAPAVQCQWSLSTYEEAMITTVVFIGMMLGSPPFGILSDRYGRRRTLWLSSFFVVYFGLMTSLVPTYAWLLVVRFCVGGCISASPQAVTYYSEFLPIRFRSPCIVMLEFAWAVGSCFEALLALLVMDTLGWRYLVGFSAIPILLVLFYFPFVPDSPRYLLASNEPERAYKVLVAAAKQNCRQLPPGQLVAHKRDMSTGEEAPILDTESDETEEDSSAPTAPISLPKIGQRGNFLELFSKEYFLTTLILLIVWFGSGFGYYGAVLVTTELFVYDNHCGITNATNTPNTCKVLTSEDYLEFLVTSIAEFPGLFATLLLSDLIGRKLTMTSEFGLSAVFYFLLLLCTGFNDKIIKTVFLFAIRGCITGAFQAAYVYTPEAYPTRIRASALALCSTMARVGAIITPFIATVLLKENFYATIFVYAGVAIASAVASFLLPFETKGRNLGDEGKKRFLC
ncbi:Synaptic vesicle 2-related protein isoform X1 [Oopsacas minuta]|uniref:Synaptic vesicle 2-related protein isoform X1 n=1 Tax=Oopsacas minuta TaxID=111878 RepID=A0AAV7JL65_9METZ|nr:Synaptic vesicle 2-related protein isoform X1 [Oopsacas minuta]